MVLSWSVFVSGKRKDARPKHFKKGELIRDKTL